jgi:hypothetical protein
MPEPYYLKQLQEALPEIQSFFESSDLKVYKQIDLSRILKKHHVEWHIFLDVPIKTFINYICENTHMNKIELLFGKSRKETRYLWGDASVYELALSLKNNSYLTHHTAAHLHGLTESTPKTICVNVEQSKKPSQNFLSQEAIDSAFRKPVRISKNVAQYKDMTIRLLNGMYTGKMGVIKITGDTGEKLQLTNIERTLIDIVVRPVYSGGVSEVLNIYRIAHKKISVNRLFDIFKKMNYVYPYHQVIGFYLEQAGVYEKKDVNLFSGIDMPFNFYLTHKMGETSYSTKWHLYYPKELD